MHGLRANDALVVAKQSPAPRSEIAAVARANAGDEGGQTTAADATQAMNDVRQTSGDTTSDDDDEEPQRCNQGEEWNHPVDEGVGIEMEAGGGENGEARRGGFGAQAGAGAKDGVGQLSVGGEDAVEGK